MIDRKGLVFRDVNPSDRHCLSTFFCENDVPEITDTFTAFPLDEDSACFITDPRRKDKYYLLLSGEKILGLSMLRGFEEGYQIPSFGILIDHRYHNLGLGRHLLALTVDQAQKIGCAKVRLSVYGTNQAGLKIYEELGFREIERSQVDRHGTPDEKIIMIKELQ